MSLEALQWAQQSQQDYYNMLLRQGQLAMQHAQPVYTTAMPIHTGPRAEDEVGWLKRRVAEVCWTV